MISNRLSNLKCSMQEKGIDGILVVKPENRRYLSGFTGTSGFLLITDNPSYILTDFRYVEQAARQCTEYQVVQHGREVVEDLKKLMNQHKIQRLGIEESFLTFSQYKEFKDSLGIELVNISKIIDNMRLVKDKTEIVLLEKAASLADEAFDHIKKFIKAGMSEREISLELEFYMRKHGATGAAFDIIVASGKRSSLPHGVASDKVIEKGDFITMDFGCIWEGYHSDITRTVIMGEPTQRQSDIYQLVLHAQISALNSVKPDLSCKDLDNIARNIIENGGYGENFGHGLGHGVGLEIHEQPRVGSTSETILEPGMVITIEPGIYIAEWGGVRIEDMVLVTENGFKVLTGSTKELLSL